MTAGHEQMIAADAVADLRFRRQVERLHRLGPRATTELLAEIGAERSIQTVINRKLATYVELDTATVEAVGADFWPAPPSANPNYRIVRQPRNQARLNRMI